MKTETHPDSPETPLHRLGDAVDFDRDVENAFALSVLPLDIFDQWDRCDLVANFLAQYFAYGYENDTSKSIISTVVNELVENAVKYSRNKSSPIDIEIRKRREDLLLRVTNAIPRNRKDHFLKVCQDLFERDLEELYLEKLTVAREDRAYSGIGLILLKKDYEALIGVDFLQTQENTLKVEISLELSVQ